LGDIAAFNSLVADRLDRCYRLAWSIIGNDADAADATQEAFVSAWRQLPNLRDAAAFDGWLNRIVANAARMGRRHRKRLREVQVIDTEIDAERGAGGSRDRGSEDIDSVAESDAIGRAFARLRPEQRAILALHHVDERPIAEIATSLAIPQGTVKSRLHDARRALERAMEAEA
jgi:RNA polymerase sigma-70 factor (ECF subfamily)